MRFRIVYPRLVQEHRITDDNYIWTYVSPEYSMLQVLIGVGKNHRMGLFYKVMIKDNHVSIVRGTSNTIQINRSILGTKAFRWLLRAILLLSFLIEKRQ